MAYLIGITSSFGTRSKFVCLERYSEAHGEYLELIDDPLADYLAGRTKANYPLPAIPLAVKYDYIGCVNIDDVSDPNDPVVVYMYDSWKKRRVE